MTNLHTIAATTATPPQNGHPRLALATSRPGCRPADVRLLMSLHRRMERVTRAYVRIADAIVARLEVA